LPCATARPTNTRIPRSPAAFEELEAQAALAGARLGHDAHDLAVAGLGLRQRRLERLHVAFAPDETRESPRTRHLQPRAQRPRPHHLVNTDRLAEAFDPGWSERLELEISFHELTGVLADCDRSGGRHGLHPRGQVRGVPDRRIFGVAPAGHDRAHHDFAGVHPDARLDRDSTIGDQLRGVQAHLLLHAQRGIERALGMVLMGNRRPEQREDAVAGGLDDVAVIAAHRIDHQPQRRIDNRARLLGVELRHQLGRALDIGEQRRDHFALAFGGVFRNR